MGCGVNGTGSGLCPMADSGTSGAESSGSAAEVHKVLFPT
jgi:hypothetical protein